MRRQEDKDNHSIFNRLSRKPLRSNTVSPDILIGPIWLPDETPGVEIIELNSSNEELSAGEPNRDNRRHAWSYVNKEEVEDIEHSYNINEQARERRRLQNANHSMMPPAYPAMEPNNWKTDVPNNFHKNHTDPHFDEKLGYNHQRNCFSIINKHLMDSDTSTDGEMEEIGIITSGDIIMGGSNNWDQQNEFYNEEIITYDADLDQETRTIWIYSFKNKHLLTGDDFEAPHYKESSSSSYSTDSSGEQCRDTSYRIGSPTTATYIPRLDLSLVPTLSTVVEISECNFEPSSDKSIKSTSRQTNMHSNNWFMCDSAKDFKRPIRKHEKSTNIINWMCLSPRERRRVLKENVATDAWIGSFLNLSEICTDEQDHGDQADENSHNEAVEVQVNVEVHVDHNNTDRNTTECELKSTNTVVRANTDVVSPINKIKYADAANEDFQKDRGDHDMKLIAPVIRLTPKLHKSFISDPIEKLENSNWILEKQETETSVYNYVLERSESILDMAKTTNAVDHIWMKNTVPFLKPSNWKKFKPIADSPISCHISIGSINERKTWFKRLVSFLKCCK